MKKIVFTLLVALFFAQVGQLSASTTAQLAGDVVSTEVDQAKQSLPGAIFELTVEDFTKLTPKKVKEMTGHKLSLKETIALKAAQKVVKRELRAADDAGEKKSQVVALLLCLFIGGLGMHRLYLGYSNWWLQLITLGGCGIWALIDLIRIIMGDMKPADGSEYDPKL